MTCQLSFVFWFMIQPHLEGSREKSIHTCITHHTYFWYFVSPAEDLPAPASPTALLEAHHLLQAPGTHMLEKRIPTKIKLDCEKILHCTKLHESPGQPLCFGTRMLWVCHVSYWDIIQAQFKSSQAKSIQTSNEFILRLGSGTLGLESKIRQQLLQRHCRKLFPILV